MKNLKDAIHGRIQRRTPRNHPASPQGRRPLLHHASYSTYHRPHNPHNPQTRSQAMPLTKPGLQQQITPMPHQAAPNQMLSHAANARFQQIPPTPHPHPAVPHQYLNALHQTLPHAGKMETACEEMHPPSGATNTIRQEIISFLRFVKSFVKLTKLLYLNSETLNVILLWILC